MQPFSYSWISFQNILRHWIIFTECNSNSLRLELLAGSTRLWIETVAFNRDTSLRLGFNLAKAQWKQFRWYTTAAGTRSHSVCSPSHRPSRGASAVQGAKKWKKNFVHPAPFFVAPKFEKKKSWLQNFILVNLPFGCSIATAMYDTRWPCDDQTSQHKNTAQLLKGIIPSVTFNRYEFFHF